MNTKIITLRLGGELFNEHFRVAVIGIGIAGKNAVTAINKQEHCNFEWPVQDWPDLTNISIAEEVMLQEICAISQCLLVLVDIRESGAIEAACKCAEFFQREGRNSYDAAVCVTLERYAGGEWECAVASVFNAILFVDTPAQMNFAAKLFDNIYSGRSTIGVSEVDLSATLAQSKRAFLIQRISADQKAALEEAVSMVATIKDKTEYHQTNIESLSLIASHGWDVPLEEIENIFEAILSGWRYGFRDACWLYAVANADAEDPSCAVTILAGTS